MFEKKQKEEVEVKSETPGYNDLVSRARKLGLPDSAKKEVVEKSEADLLMKLPK